MLEDYNCKHYSHYQKIEIFPTNQEYGNVDPSTTLFQHNTEVLTKVFRQEETGIS